MDENIQYLETTAGKIAYFYAPPKGREVTILFLHGFFSSMQKTKGQYLHNLCIEKGYGFLSLDYSGHGLSSGEFEQGCISQWLQDCEAVIQFVGARKLIVVGSSLGGWMMLHIAMQLPDFVAGLIGISVAPDFTREILLQLAPQQRHDLETTGKFTMSSEYRAGGVAITKNLLDDGEQLAVFGKGGIPCPLPVRLLHGLQDKDCPFAWSLQLMQELTSTDIELTLIKEGDHSLSAPHNLRLLRQVVMELVNVIEGGGEA